MNMLKSQHAEKQPYSDISTYYNDEIYHVHKDNIDLWRSGGSHHFYDEVKPLNTFLVDGNLLNMGCSIGGQDWGFQKLGHKTYGIDISFNAIKNRVLNTCIVGNIVNMPYKNRAFNNVLALDILEHLPYEVLENAIKEIERITNKVFLARMPFEGNAERYKYTKEDGVFEHYTHLEPKEWESLFDKYFVGFKGKCWEFDRTINPVAVRWLYRYERN